MRKTQKLLAVASLIGALASASYAATITGTVKSPEGQPAEGAFVQAQNTKTRMTFIVLTDAQGRYRVDNLPAGDYTVQARTTGFRAEAQSGVSLTSDQNASFDFPMQKTAVRWNELSIYQAKKLLPASEGKDKLFQRCFVCHGFQTRMASVRRDADGWQDRVQFMRDAMHFSLGWRFNDQEAALVSTFLNNSFGTDSTLPKSPAEMPEYKDIARKFTGETTHIAFVEYDMPGPSRMPFSAAPDKDGNLWIPNFGIANKITRLDPKTAKMEDFPVPNIGTAAVHSAYPAPDGSVWLAEQGSNKIGRWDPKTQKITEYQDPYLAGKEGTEDGGAKHTVRVDRLGNVWATGYPLSRFDPETGKFTDFWDIAPHTYDLELDKDGNIWFTNPGTGQIGVVDYKTLKIKQWTVPSKDGYERRLQIDSKGIVWFAEYQNGKIGRFDPKTEMFKEYDLPGGKDVFPYAVGIDTDDNIWYASYYMDILGRIDQKTGKITEFPFPHSEITIREILRDAQGRMWYGSPSNNKVGYFYLTGSAAH